MSPAVILILLGFLALVLILFFWRRSSAKINQEARGYCIVCAKALESITLIDGNALCSQHAHDYQHGNWRIFKEGVSSPEDPEFGVRLHLLQRKFASEKIASYIQVRYQEKDGEILTLMELMVLEKDLKKAEGFGKSANTSKSPL